MDGKTTVTVREFYESFREPPSVNKAVHEKPEANKVQAVEWVFGGTYVITCADGNCYLALGGTTLRVVNDERYDCVVYLPPNIDVEAIPF